VHGIVRGGAIRSDDAGATWSPLPSELPGAPIGDALIRGLAIDPVDSRRVYATTLAGVFRSVDRASTWTPLNDGLPTYQGVPMFAIGDLSIDRTGTLLRAATENGVFEYRFATAGPPSDVGAAIEYYNASFDHYFVTALPDEIALLDSGAFPHWKPTGLSFHVYAAPAAGTSPVCRFFSTAFGFRSTHFYTPFAFECESVKANEDWMLESEAVFHTRVPSGDGSCAAGLLPVYRLFNNGQGGAPNHRYTTERAVRTQMTALGWVAEGLGPDAVQMCSPL
jgi:hypothetical protein